MPATWPATIPTDVLLNAITSPTDDGIQRTNMDAGPDKLRPRYMPVASRTLQAALYLTDRQVATIQSFYTDTLKRVGTFTFPDTVGDAALEWRFTAPPAATLTVGGTPANLASPELDPAAPTQRLHNVRINLEAVASA